MCKLTGYRLKKYLQMAFSKALQENLETLEFRFSLMGPDLFSNMKEGIDRATLIFDTKGPLDPHFKAKAAELFKQKFPFLIEISWNACYITMVGDGTKEEVMRSFFDCDYLEEEAAEWLVNNYSIYKSFLETENGS